MKLAKHVKSMVSELVGTLVCISALVVLVPHPAQAKTIHLSEVITSLSEVSQDVAERAERAVQCSTNHGKTPEMVIVVDMSIPANKKRLWAFDLNGKPELLVHDYVTHGKGSDPDFKGVPEVFSNEVNSGMTSLGLYQVAEAYEGKHGPSRRLDGLTPGWNDRARQRAVVMHPSNYVRPGAVGRSLGCPAVRQEVLDELEKHGLGNALLWIDGPDDNLEHAVADCNASKRYTPSTFARYTIPREEPKRTVASLFHALMKDLTPLERTARQCLPKNDFMQQVVAFETLWNNANVGFEGGVV